jgi:hypothetical protein
MVPVSCGTDVWLKTCVLIVALCQYVTNESRGTEIDTKGVRFCSICSIISLAHQASQVCSPIIMFAVRKLELKCVLDNMQCT